MFYMYIYLLTRMNHWPFNICFQLQNGNRKKFSH